MPRSWQTRRGAERAVVFNKTSSHSASVKKSISFSANCARRFKFELPLKLGNLSKLAAAALLRNCRRFPLLLSNLARPAIKLAPLIGIKLAKQTGARLQTLFRRLEARNKALFQLRNFRRRETFAPSEVRGGASRNECFKCIAFARAARTCKFATTTATATLQIRRHLLLAANCGALVAQRARKIAAAVCSALAGNEPAATSRLLLVSRQQNAGRRFVAPINQSCLSGGEQKGAS